MSKSAMIILYVVAMVATVVIVDMFFFRRRPWRRLLVNIGIVLIYAACYLVFLKNR